MKLKRTCLLIFILVWCTHFLSQTITVTDSVWVLPLSMSMIREHNTNLDEYRQLIEAKHYYGVENINGHYYYMLPIGTSLLIAPVIKIIDYCCAHILYMDLQTTIAGGYGNGLELFLASFMVALTAVIIFLIAFQITKGTAQSLLAVFVFAFCTSAWSIGSRALWSHTASMLMLSATLLALLKSNAQIKWLFVAGLAIAYAYVIRPTNSLSVIFFSLYVLLVFRKNAWLFAAGALLVFIPFLAYNHHLYHHLLSNYYMPQQLKVGGNNYLINALMANLFSPARGLLVFSPVLVFSFFGIVVLLSQKEISKLHWAVLAIILAHYYIISSISTPFAGWSFGPRYFCDMIPYFIFFLIYFVQYLADMNNGIRKYGIIVLFGLTITTSFFIHYKGATHPSTFMWNASPDINDHPERIWDWNDLQFMR
jgi:hypothetical protein